MHVVCAADSAYAMPLGVMLRSALASLGPGTRLAIHVVDAGIPDVDWERIADLCRGGGTELRRVRPPADDVAGLPTWGRMPETTYHRLMLARLLPPEVERAIWLDCDMLVERDLTALWNVDLDGHALLAARDRLVPLVSSRYGVRSWRSLGLRAEAAYFNSGVMVVDVGRWRDEQVEDRAVRYLRGHRDEIVFWDQEGLNAVLSDRWKEIDPRWNWPARTEPDARSGPAEQGPWILHFNGMLKPWLLPEPPAGPRARFYRHLDETPWAGWRPPRTRTSAALGWYEASALRGVLAPAEPWVMVSLRRRLLRRPRR